MKAGTVALVGRPNAGKSTLLNRLVGQKLAIVSDKPQTTRHRILGVRSRPGVQMVFWDTPGIHKPAHQMNQRMVETAFDACREADVVCLLVDATARPGAGDAFVSDRLRGLDRPVILALNKIDLIHKPRLLPLMERFARQVPFRAIVPISARTGEGVDQLEGEIVEVLPVGDAIVPDDYFTDQTERTLAAEIVREKVLVHTRDELPHATHVVIDKFEEPAAAGGLTRIFMSILVDRASQRSIVLGRGGTMLKRIGSEARRELETLLGGPVYLDLHVKVREDWRDNARLLDEMGLRHE